MDTWKTLIHVHTEYSPDSRVSLSALERAVLREGVACVAITDHDTIEGAIAFARQGPCRVIVGEEISTRDGHLVGLFLEEAVPPGLSAKRSAELIREQGGVVVAVHPFARLCERSLGALTYELGEWLDAVEVFNAQNVIAGDDALAVALAARLGVPGLAGSDTHLPCSIAPCWQEMAPFTGAAEFMRSLRGARLYCRRHPLRYFVEVGCRVALEKALGWRPGCFGRLARGPDYTLAGRGGGTDGGPASGGWCVRG